MAGGFMIQWGHVYGLKDTGSYGNSQTINFPRAFNNRCFAVVACPDDDKVYDGAGVIYTKLVSRYSFKLTLDGVKTVGNMSAVWVAFGY